MLSDGRFTNACDGFPTQISGYNHKFDLGMMGYSSRQVAARSLCDRRKMLQHYKISSPFYGLLQQYVFRPHEPADFLGSAILGDAREDWPAGLYASMAELRHTTTSTRPLMSRYSSAPLLRVEGHSNKTFTLIPVMPHPFIQLPAMQEVMLPCEEGLCNSFTASNKIAWKTGTSLVSATLVNCIHPAT